MTPHPLFDLTGRVALITGASRGIGEAIAHLLAEHGAHVICSSRKPEGCEAVAQAIRDKGLRAESHPCHIGEMDQIAATIAHVEARHGRLDILVNNAATNPYFGHILDTDPGSFQKTLDVNIRGYFFMSQAAGKLMRVQGKGAIVNVASVNALEPGDAQGTYSITKAAVVNMTQAFAKECASLGLRVNAIAPGWTRTRFAGALPADEASGGAAGNGRGRALPRLRRGKLHDGRIAGRGWRPDNLKRHPAPIFLAQILTLPRPKGAWIDARNARGETPPYGRKRRIPNAIRRSILVSPATSPAAVPTAA